jgi:hypothetical protein
MQWIHVDEERAPENETVLLLEQYREYGYWHRRWFRGYHDYASNEWRDLASMRTVTGTVTHWMAVEMPEEKER